MLGLEVVEVELEPEDALECADELEEPERVDDALRAQVEIVRHGLRELPNSASDSAHSARIIARCVQR